MRCLSGYEDWLRASGLSSNTIRQRLAFVDRLLRQWDTLDVPPHVVADWLAQYDGWTRHTYLNHARSAYGFLTTTGQLASSPVERVRPVPQPPARPSPLSQDELALVLTCCAGDIRAWVLLAYLAGLRAHEIAKLRGEDVSEVDLYVRGKGGKVAVLPTHPGIWGLAQTYPRVGWWFPSSRRGGHGHVLPGSVSSRISTFFRQLGIDHGSIHRLRHTYGTTLSRNGVETRVIQELMRHSSLETTQRYLEVGSEQKRSAIASLVA